MKKRFRTGRGLLAATLMVAGGGALAFWATAPAGAAGTPPQISVVTGHSGTGLPTLGKPKVAATAGISPTSVAYNSANGDEAVTTDATGVGHVYLIAGSTANPYHIETATGVYGTLVVGDAYLVAGDATSGMISDPGATTPTTGGSTSAVATSNPVSPISVAFDNQGNLLIAERLPSTGPTRSGIQEVAITCSTACGYGYSTTTAGDLYTVAAVGSWRGSTRTPAIGFEFQVDGFGMAVDAQGDIVIGAQGNVLFLNETSAPITRYGKTLTNGVATVIAGTATHGSATCGGGSKTVAATGASSPDILYPHPFVDSSGNVFLNDDRPTATTHKGCDWVLPAASAATLDGQAVTAGDLTSLTGAPGTTAYASAGTADTTAFPDSSEVAVDPAGNLVVGTSGTHPALYVVAESNGTYYDQHMHKYDVYQVAGGGTGTTLPENAETYGLPGAARTAAAAQYGITSLTRGATGDLLLTDGSGATTMTAYQVNEVPTAKAGPTTTSTTLVVTPTTAYVGTTVTLTATVAPSTAVGKVAFYTGSTKLATVTLSGGHAVYHTGPAVAGTYHYQAKFTPTDATTFGPSTSAIVTYAVSSATTKVTPVIQQIAETVKPGELTLSCTHAVTVEATAIKVCPLITLPQVTLNGHTQTKSAKMNTIYVNTARGTATSGWSLSAVMIPTVDTLNTNPSCATIQGFCNSSDGTHAANSHGQIPATDLKLAGYSCTPAVTNHNPTPTPSAGGTLLTSLGLCAATAGTSGGVFDIKTGTFTLTIPSTNYHGLYYGTVQYTLVSVA
jgi:hypothetical protein